MNKLFLSGRICSDPTLISTEGDAHHLAFSLEVCHRTAKGILKSEMYIVNAWNSCALWGMQHLRKGTKIALRGYLTQRMHDAGACRFLSTEITAEEFLLMQQTPGDHANGSFADDTV